jgi:hypothetical protein
MNDSGLPALLQRVTSDLTASPDVAARAWDEATRRSRRATFVVTGSVGVALVLIVVLVSGPLTRKESTPPVTTPSPTVTSDSSKAPQPLPDYFGKLAAAIQPPFEDAEIDNLPRLNNALPQQLDPFAMSAVPALSEDPVDAALAVAQRRTGTTLDIRVLGDDQRWRQLDTPSLQPTFSDSEVVSLINGSPLSPDGTQLALPQPDALVIVDLSTGSSRRIDLPADPTPAWIGWMTEWSPDGSQILVGHRAAPAHRASSYLVDTRTSATESVPYDATSTAFAPDGSLLEMTTSAGLLAEIRTHAEGDSAVVLLGVERYAPRPAVGQVVAFSRAVRAWKGSRLAPVNSDGILVVDPDDGAPLGFLPMRPHHQAENSELVGWLDRQTVLIHLFVPALPWARDALIAWNYESGQLWTMTDPWKWNDDFEIAFASDQL